VLQPVLDRRLRIDFDRGAALSPPTMGLERAAGDAWWGDVTNEGGWMDRQERARTMTVPQRVRCVVAEELGFSDDDIASDASIVTDLGADSHDRQNLTLQLEEEFDLEIPDRDGQQLLTVRQIVDYIERRWAEKNLPTTAQS
jgi:acyl carrier protein